MIKIIIEFGDRHAHWSAPPQSIHALFWISNAHALRTIHTNCMCQAAFDAPEKRRACTPCKEVWLIAFKQQRMASKSNGRLNVLSKLPLSEDGPNNRSCPYTFSYRAILSSVAVMAFLGSHGRTANEHLSLKSMNRCENALFPPLIPRAFIHCIYKSHERTHICTIPYWERFKQHQKTKFTKNRPLAIDTTGIARPVWSDIGKRPFAPIPEKQDSMHRA